VLWDLLQENDEPSYGVLHGAHPGQSGRHDHDGERWTRGDSKNHMIPAHIEDWFHTHLAGIRTASGSTAYGQLIIQPRLVRDLTFVDGSDEMLTGRCPGESGRWQREEHG
jgi:alpha-L-rhamnosidase